VSSALRSSTQGLIISTIACCMVSYYLWGSTTLYWGRSVQPGNQTAHSAQQMETQLSKICIWLMLGVEAFS
jgi:hypothetical protein